jgi:A/G-specific adenine glycosylase
LLAWFDRSQRPLPWRAGRDPYAVWLSEIILQQTRVDQGIAYWQRFIARWPNVRALAAADEQDILKMWQGLGYYARARNLHRAAQVVRDRWGGEFPRTAAELRELPGVGPYTAAAIASICFGEAVAAVDGNVQRVVTRFFGSDLPVDRPEGAAFVAHGASALLNPGRAGDFNQAMMELGATVCTPRTPDCAACPLSNCCASTLTEALARPVKAGRTRVVEVVWSFHVLTDGERVAMRRRPAGGVWGGLWEFPTELGELEPATAGWQLAGMAHEATTHLLSHRRIEAHFPLWIRVKSLGFPGKLPEDWQWIDWQDAADLAVPRLVDKVWDAAREAAASAAANCMQGLPTFGDERPHPWLESTK